jgi:hypothetical protein
MPLCTRVPCSCDRQLLVRKPHFAAYVNHCLYENKPRSCILPEQESTGHDELRAGRDTRFLAYKASGFHLDAPTSIQLLHSSSIQHDIASRLHCLLLVRTRI